MTNEENIHVLTHTDLDGIGCAILFEKAYPNVQTFPVDYRDLDTAIPAFLENAKGHKAFITDLSLNDSQAVLCNAFGNIQHIDHHSSSKKLMDNYPWSFTDVSHCATYHLWKMLSIYFELADLEPFVNLVDDYDTWGHGTQPSEEAKELNRLLYMIGAETFVKRFKMSSSIKLSATEKAIIAADTYQEEVYIRDSMQYLTFTHDEDGIPCGIIAAERYTNSLGNFILNEVPEVEYVIILDFHTSKVSLRGKGNVDVGEIAKRHGGGGHHKSAGYMMRPLEVE